MELTKTIQKLKAGKDIKIVALGDSLTYGWMVHKGYVEYLKEMLLIKYPGSTIKTINRGIPGDTAGGGLYRLEDHVIITDPDLAIVQFALNDAFSGHTVNTFKRNILAIIRTTKEKTTAEILLTTSSALAGNDKHMATEYYNALMEAAQEEDVPIACVHEYWGKKMDDGIQFSELVQSDQVHPTETGYRLMAEAIVEKI